MSPSTDLSHSSRPRPFIRWCVINEWIVSAAALDAGNALLDCHLFLKETLKNSVSSYLGALFTHAEDL